MTSSPILIGTSGYSFDDWTGPFYPAGTPKGKRLDYYATQFPCVEINSTYYGIPIPAIMARLAEKVPTGFEFTAKAYEAMTHKRSKDPDLYARYLDAIAPLRDAGKFHGVILQFPWGFRNERDNRAHLAFLRQKFHGLDAWAEFRHDSWNRPELYRFLKDLGLGFIAVDEPPLPGLFPPVACVTNDIAYSRFHGRNAATWWADQKAPAGRSGHTDRYDWDYTAAELSGWVDKIRHMASRARKSYVFFNNCYLGRAVRSARLMSGLLSPAS